MLRNINCLVCFRFTFTKKNFTEPMNNDSEDAKLFRFWASELCAQRNQVHNALGWCRTPTEVRNALSALLALKTACSDNESQ
jgi:hypothetical protein